ncbi:hypothetical protein PPERSA_01545 [Pseudocohnilembus persalinus]|uniref:Pentacotripeptide-repeat region of PRORP domain-containing protein n=1 Tax=Pseudocohnilembus persalinus TaxID=266149 RepID=A0A0V0R8E9_PSEPJ|nr:hypothetical protein PPERSA_01545 [Pseudocohnilembus persalinus]|eukprot:KRX10533.1 hypothetical protein PPERSA_01545 [Pseudocohnilembus persalinus]
MKFMKVQENKQKQPDQDRIQEFCEYIKDVYYQHDTLNVGKIFKVLQQENLKPDQKIYYKIVQIAIKKQDLRSIIKCFEYFNKENQDNPNFEEEQQAMIQNLFKQISFGSVNKDELRQFLLDLKRHILPQHLGYITDQSVKFQVVEPILFFFDHYKNNVSTQIQTLKSFKALTYKQTNQFYQSLVYKYLQLKEIEDHVGCLLLEITLKFNDIQLAEILFEKLESYSKDLQSLYQTMIRNIPPQKNYQVMVRYFNKMKEIPSVEINEVTFGQVIDCCVKNNQLNLAQQLLNDNKYSNCIVYTTLIKGYSKEKNFDQANKLFQQMKKSDDPKIKPNMVTYNSMLECSIQCQRFEEMQQIYKEITQQEQNQDEQGIKADLITHSTFIKGLCKARYIDQALELFDQIRESKQYDIDEVLYNSLLDGLLKIQECKWHLEQETWLN